MASAGTGLGRTRTPGVPPASVALEEPVFLVAEGQGQRESEKNEVRIYGETQSGVYRKYLLPRISCAFRILGFPKGNGSVFGQNHTCARFCAASVRGTTPHSILGLTHPLGRYRANRSPSVCDAGSSGHLVPRGRPA